MSDYRQEAAMAHGAGNPLWHVEFQDKSTGKVFSSEVAATDGQQATNKALHWLSVADMARPAPDLGLRSVRLASTVHAQMAYEYRSAGVASSTVAVDSETGEFDEARSFGDLPDDDTERPVSQYLTLGKQRFEVERVGDHAMAYFNEETLAWSLLPRRGYVPVPVDAAANTMPMRVVDLEAFREALVVIDTLCDDSDPSMKPFV